MGEALGLGLPGFGVGLAGGVVGDGLADAEGLIEGDGLADADGLTDGEGGLGVVAGGFAETLPAMSPPNTSHAVMPSTPIAAARTGPRGLVGGWSTLGLVTDRGRCPGRRQPRPSPVRARNDESCTSGGPERGHLAGPVFLRGIRAPEDE